MSMLYRLPWIAFTWLFLVMSVHAQSVRGAASGWSLPPTLSLDYQLQGTIKGFHYQASSRLQWQQQAQRYHLQLDTKLPLLGTRSQSSDGLIVAQGLSPDRYSEQTRKTHVATVDRKTRKVNFSADGGPVDWQAGAQDRLSVVLQIGHWLRSQPQQARSGKVFDVQVIGSHDAPVWHFELEAQEEVALPMGRVQAYKFRRLPREGRAVDDQVIEFWLAPAYRYLPVRLHWSEDGDGADQLLSQIQGL